MQLVPNAEEFEVRMNIGDKSCSMEFFAVINGKRYQCYDMIDTHMILEKDFDLMLKQCAEYVRKSSEYQPGKTNKFSFSTIA